MYGLGLERAYKKIAFRQCIIINSVLVLEQEIAMIGTKLGVENEDYPEHNDQIKKLLEEIEKCNAEIKKLNEEDAEDNRKMEELMEKWKNSPVQAFSDLAPKAEEGGPQA